MKKIIALLVTVLFLSGSFFQNSYAKDGTKSRTQKSSTIPLIALKAFDKYNNPMSNALVEIIPDAPNITKATFLSKTDKNGIAAVNYHLSQTDLDLASKNNGNLNFFVVVSKKGQAPDVYHFARNINVIKDNAQLQSLSDLSSVKLGPKSVELKPNGKHSKWDKGLAELKNASSQNTVTTQTIQPNDLVCQYNVVDSSSETDWTTIGELHNGANSTASFMYGQTADSTIDTGYSTDGTNWSINGSAQVSNYTGGYASLSDISWYQYGYELESQFIYSKKHWQNACGYHYYTVTPVDWVAGITTGAYEGYNDGNHSLSPYPAYFIANGGYSKSSGSAETYSAGVNAFGVNLSVKSGYSTYVSLSWSFSGPGYLYGLNDTIGNSKIIYAE